MKWFVIALAILVSASCDARPRGGTVGVILPPVTSCTTDGNDGLSGAPAATIQNAALRTSYAYMPTWCLPGVDYAVGYATGTSLADPSSAPPTGCSYASNVLTCDTTSGRTVDGFDFSLHSGIGLVMTGPNAVVRNNKFTVGSSCKTPITFGSSGTKLTGNNQFYQNIVDGGGTTCGSLDTTALISTLVSTWIANGGSFTAYYNWLKNSPQHVFENGGPASGSASFTEKWNYIEAIGYFVGAHGNNPQFNGGNFDAPTMAYNTVYSPQPSANITATVTTTNGNATLTSVGLTANALNTLIIGAAVTGTGIQANSVISSVNSGSATITLSKTANASGTVTATITTLPVGLNGGAAQFTAQLTSAITNGVVNNNFFSFPGPLKSGTYVIECNRVPPDTNTGFSASNNYIDLTGVLFGAIYPNGQAGSCTTPTYTNNVDPVVGTVHNGVW